MEKIHSIFSIRSEIKMLLQNSHIDKDLKNDVILKIDKLIYNKDNKINLIFFGAASSGKTSSINLLLEYFLEKSDDSRNEEDQIFSLITAEAENTYYFTFIEKSSSDYYEVIFDIKDENERKIINESKIFEFTIDEENPIKFYFPNSNEGRKELDEFLEKIDDISMQFLEMIRKNEMSNSNMFKPSIKIIKVPNFPKEYRIVDTPGISIENLANNFLEIFSEFNYINVIIFVQDILSQVTYNRDSELLKTLNNQYGKPFVYSFHTKGKIFLEKFYSNNKRLIKKKEKENKTNLAKYCEINSLYFDRIKDYKYNEIYFRKIIPIIDNDYDNENVKKNLDIFNNDLENILEKYGKFNHDKCLDQKLRRIITNLNDKVSKKFLLTENERKYIELDKDKTILKYQDEIREYFNKFDTFDKYKDYYPDHIKKLENIYKRNQSSNDFWNKNNHVQNHVESTFREFQDLIVLEINKIIQQKLSNFFYKLEGPIFEKINIRLKQEGNYISGNRGLKFRIRDYKSSIFNYLPFWSYNSAKEDVFKAIFEFFVKHKGEYLIKFKDEYELKMNEIVKEIYQKKEIQNIGKDLLNIVDQIYLDKPQEIDFEFREEEYLDLIEDENLKKFLKEAINLLNPTD